MRWNIDDFSSGTPMTLEHPTSILLTYYNALEHSHMCAETSMTLEHSPKYAGTLIKCAGTWNINAGTPMKRAGTSTVTLEHRPSMFQRILSVFQSFSPCDDTARPSMNTCINRNSGSSTPQMVSLSRSKIKHAKKRANNNQRKLAGPGNCTSPMMWKTLLVDSYYPD